MGDQLTLTPAALVPDRDDVAERLCRAGLRASSLRRYLNPARSWEVYCSDRELDPSDAPTGALIAWLDARCRRSVSHESAIRIGIAAARHVQRARALLSGSEPLPYARSARPQLDAWCASILADDRMRTRKRARALRLDELATLVSTLRAHVRPRPSVSWARAIALCKRDCALLLVGWWGAYRSDDLARLTWDDLAFAPLGVEVTTRTSKTTGAVCALALQSVGRLCPVQALAEWRHAELSRASSLVFGLSSPGHVARRLKELLTQCAPGYTSHSLRAGFATECAAQGVPDKLVQHHARWSSAQQHAEYVRSGRLWLDTPTTRLVLPEDV